MVERGGLENRCGCKPTQGSNPCLSANIAGNMLYLKGKVSSAEFVPHFVPQCNRNFEPDGPMLGWLVDRKIAPHIPVIDQAGRTDGTWSRADFEWDAENNQYICPEGEALKQFRRNYSDPNRGPTGKGVARYQALKHTCQARPPIETQMLPKADCRKITREEHEDARDMAWAIARTTQYKVFAKLRKKVEMLFAHQTHSRSGAAPITRPMRRK